MSTGKYRKEKNCLNCNHIVEEHYCSSCGQPNLELKENFWAFITHSIAHYFHFDNKFFSTVKPLLLKPGQVTLDYLAGKRARYINPVSLYIFVSIVYFLVVPHSSNNDEEKDLEKAKIAVEQINKTVDKSPLKKLGSAGAIMSRAVAREEFEKLSFKTQEKIILNLKKQNDSTHSELGEKLLNTYEKAHIIKADSTYESYLNRQKLLAEDDKDDWFERISKKREITLNQKAEKENWSLDEQIEHYRPKQFFLLMPLLALFIMWNFRKNKIFYIDHLVFTIHGMTAYFILQMITVPIRYYVFGLDSTISDIIEFTVAILMLWYIYKGFRLFYQRSKWQTIRKIFTLGIMCSIAFVFSEWIIEQFIFYFLG